MRDAVIVDAARTPIGKGKAAGDLAPVHPVELLAHSLRALADRTGIDPAQIDDVIGGCVDQGGQQAANTTRWAVLAAGFPETVPATTVDRQCGSSQQAVHFAAQGILAGAYDIAVACGVESMSRVSMGSNVLPGSDPFGPGVADRYPDGLVPQGISAELIAAKWNLSRAELDEFSAASHHRAASQPGQGQRPRRRHRPRPSARGQRCQADDHLGPCHARTGRPPGAADHVRSGRPGQRDHPGTSLTTREPLTRGENAMDPQTATPATRTAVTPRLEVSLEDSGPFLRAAGLVFDEISATRVTGHLELGPEHHTPWGVVHGGVYTAAVETAASVGASTAIRDQGQVAVGLTNTTHFLRAVTAGRVNIEATALSQGRTQQLWRVDFTDESGRLIAHGELRLQNVAGKP